MTIGKRLYLNFGLILAILLGLFAANTWSLLREQSAKADAVRSIEVARGMEAVRFQMMQNRMVLQNYLLSGDTREADRVKEGSTKLADLLKTAQENAMSGVQRNALVKVERLERDWLSNFAGRMVEKRKEVDAGNATVADLQVAYLTLEPESWVTKSTEPLDEAQAEMTRLLAMRNDSDASATRWTMILSVLCTLVALGMGIAIALRTSKSITEPLAHLIGVAREIGDSGDLNHKIDIQRKDEIGELGRTFANMVNYLKEMAVTSERIAGGDLAADVTPRSDRDTLAHAFSRMTESLRSTVSTVRDSAAQVAAGSNQVADASDESAKISVKASSAIDEVTSTMHEMTINVQNMVRNTQTQASSVSETSASIDEMVASIQRVADTAKVLLDISNRSREEVQSGISTMQKATDGLNRINESIGSSAGIISELGQRADDIGKIIEVIDDISEQTNLLALNAAIEAARAGEHGLGFAVVADEVRKLAEKSAQSTKEISELIQSIQKEARKAVDDMSRSTTIVNDGLNLGSELSNALRKISSVVTEVYKFAQEIGAATNEQSHGSSQIAKATTRLNEITHEITSSVEEQAGGAQAVVRAMERMRELIQQTTSGSTELAASAEQMSKMSRSLLEAMDVFVLNGHNGNGNGNGRKGFNFEKVDPSRDTAAKYAATARS
jgi:methyl-accepting chemotaxis protein